MAFVGGVKTDADVKRMEQIAARVGKIEGVEDVSFGQGWVKNYSRFVSAISASGGVIVLILIIGSLFVTGNSIRVSVSGRREEVEILELVGATPAMIRRPFVMEGLLTGFIASVIAIALNIGAYAWQCSLMKPSLIFAGVADQISLPGVLQALGLLLIGTLMGAVGALLAVRQINDGWSASHRATH